MRSVHRGRLVVIGVVAVALLASAAACGTRLPDEAFDAEQAVAAGASREGGEASAAESAQADQAGTVEDSGPTGPAAAASTEGAGQASADGGGARGPNQASDVGVTATTIRLGTIVAENGILGDAFAPAVWGLRAWVAHTNAQGGIAGRTIELFTCDDREDRARTLQCAQRLVERDRVFALVAVNTRSIGGAATYLDQSGIPVIGFPIGNSFHRFSRFFSAYGSVYPRDGKQVGFGDRLVSGTASIRFYKERLGAQRAAVFAYDIDESAQAANGLQRGLEAEGFSVNRYDVSFAAPSFDTAVAEMQRDGVQVIFDTMDHGANIRLCDAMQRRGFKPLAKVTTVTAFGDAVETTLNDSCRPVTYIFSYSRPYSATDVPFIATFDRGMRRYQPGRPLHQWSLEAWVQGEVVRQALVALGPAPTRAAFEAHLEGPEGISIPGVLATPLRWDHRPEAATRTLGRCFAIVKWEDDAPGHWTTPGGFPYCPQGGGRVFLTEVSEQGT